MIQEPEDILDNIEMHLIDTFDRRLRAMEILKIFIDNKSVVKENELLHSVSNRRELLLDFADLVMINDCDLHTKEERALAVDKYLKGKL